MKQLTIDLNNKEKLILVEVPMDAHSFSISHKHQGLGWREEEMNESVLNYKTIDLEYGEKNALIFLGDKANYLLYNPKFSILGTYLPRTGEIDFHDKIKGAWCIEKSFSEILKIETEKAFPLKENQYAKEYNEILKYGRPQGWASDYEEPISGAALFDKLQDQWQESESKVMPKRFIVLKSL